MATAADSRLADVKSTWATIVAFGLFSALFFSLQPMKNCLLAHHAPKQAQGLTYGFIFFLEFGIGSFGSSLGGLMADRWGLGSIFNVTAILLVAMAGLAALMIPRKEDT